MDTRRFRIREFEESDTARAEALGNSVVRSWNQIPSAFLHQVAEQTDSGEIVAHMQAVDRSVPEPSRRPGEVHFRLIVAPVYRRQGIGAALLQQVETFARRRGARLLYAASGAGEAGEAFLQHQGFEEWERFLPSRLCLDNFRPDDFTAAVRRVEAQGYALTTLVALGNASRHLRRIYALEQRTRADVPFRGVTAPIPVPFDAWLAGGVPDPETTFLALTSGGRFAGMVLGMDWNYTGVHPRHRGRGVATALKVRMLTAAKERGMAVIHTENHATNAPMLAVNRALGFVFDTPEVALVKRLTE